MTITALPTPPTRSDPVNFASRADAFLAALPTFTDEANALAVAMNFNDTTDTSTSSVAIGTGSKSFSVTPGKSFQAGMFLVIADSAAPSTNWMVGQVTAYAGSGLTVDVSEVRGSGTIAAWTITQSAPNVDLAYGTHAATDKATPVDADELPLSDSAATFGLKKLTWANLKATLLTWLQGTVFPAPGAIGATTPAAGSFTTVGASGAITQSNVTGAFFVNNGTTTASKYASIGNTSGNITFGVDSSTGGGIITGSTAYETAITGKAGIAFSANDGANLQMRLTSTGLNNTAIGATTPAAGSFTTVSASTSVNCPDYRINATGFLTYDSTNIGGQSLVIRDGAGNYIAQVSSTGLAVTAAISATGNGITQNGTSNSGFTVNMTDTTQASYYYSYSGVVKWSTQALGDGSGWRVYDHTNGERMRLDAAGNLGLGVTPSAWGAPFKSFDGAAGSFAHASDGSSWHLTQNAYYNGANWLYKATGYAGDYYQYNGDHVWQIAPSGTAGDPITFTQAMTLDASGNLGIGTSSPGAKLAVKGGNAGQLVLDNSNEQYVQQVFQRNSAANSGADFLLDGTGNTFNFRTLAANMPFTWQVSATAGNPSERMRLDAAGNLGLGVTPSAWNVTKAIQLSASGAVYGEGVSYDFTAGISQSAYRTGLSTWAYSLTNPAARFELKDNTFSWYNAPSGTAGDEITFTQAMTLDASGNLLVGSASSLATEDADFFKVLLKVPYVGHISGTPSATDYAGFRYAGTSIGSITQSGTTAVAYNTTSDHRLKTNVRPANAARFMDIAFVDFEWTDGRHDCGVIADQLQSVYPDLVLGTKDATEVRTVEITPAVPAVTEQVLLTPAVEAVLDEDGNVVTEAVAAVYETVEITPAIPAVTEDQTFPVYQQVNYMGLIGRMGTRIQQLQRTVDEQAELILLMNARLTALEAA